MVTGEGSFLDIDCQVLLLVLYVREEKEQGTQMKGEGRREGKVEGHRYRRGRREGKVEGRREREEKRREENKGKEEEEEGEDSTKKKTKTNYLIHFLIRDLTLLIISPINFRDKYPKDVSKHCHTRGLEF